MEPLLATDDNMPFILTCLQGADEIAIDTETTGLEVRSGKDYLMGFPLAVSGLNCYIPFRHKTDNVSMRWAEPFYDILRIKPLVWHNRKFDMHSVKTFGYDPLSFQGPQYCTQILAWMINEELPSKELDWLAKVFLKESKIGHDDQFYKYGSMFGFDTIPPDMAVKRATDARLTGQLKEIFWPKIIEQELESVYWETEEPFTRLLYKLEQRGIGRDLDLCEEKERIGSGRMATIQRTLKLNPASPIELGRYLLDELNLPVVKHTKSCDACKNGAPVGTHEGPPSFDKSAMEEYDDILSLLDNHDAQLITEFRGWQKAVTSFYRPMIEKADAHGIVRTNFKQHGTRTRRLSSSDPNLQQIPRSTDKRWNGKAKACFVSTQGPDYAVYGWDYSQLEFRLGAAYGEETDLIAEFSKDDADPFSLLAPRIFGVLTPETRHKTKNGFVYPRLYGAGIGKVALSLGMTVDEVKPLYRQFESTIPGIISVSNQVGELIKQRGWVKYWDGSRRHMPKSKSYAGFNSVCQGGASQLVKRAMLRLEEHETDDFYMVLQVHDEITFVIRRDLIEKYEPIVQDCMTNFDFGVRLMVEGKEWK